MEDIFSKKLDSFYLNNPFFKEGNNETPNHEQIRVMILFLLTELELPNYVTIYSDSIINIHFLNYLSLLLWRNLDRTYRIKLINMKITATISCSENEIEYINARILGDNGTYPGDEINIENTKYTIHHGLPMLITHELKIGYFIEKEGFINKSELVFTAAVLLSDINGIFHFDLNSTHQLMIPYSAFKELDQQSIKSFIFDLLIIQDKKSSETYHVSDSFFNLRACRTPAIFL
ncbi:MAG: hypothetical protein JW904_03820 [Spirochaetales bacterium]|nr:hypothetical protein [Spirochaetales bacterium]